MQPFSIDQTHPSDTGTVAHFGTTFDFHKPNAALTRRWWWSAIVAIGINVSGCAVKQDANKRTVISLDHAALLGTERARFQLQDGAEGSLRSMGDEYSLKLEKFSKVIPLGRAQQMQMQPVYQINGRTVLVINMQHTSGCVKTTLLSIQDSQVFHWLITPSDCKSVPALAANEQRLQLSYSGSRYVYENGQLIEEKPFEVETPKPPSSNDGSRNPPRNNARAVPSAEASKRANRSAAKTPAAQTPQLPTAALPPTTAPPVRQASRASIPNVASTTQPPDLRFSRSAEAQKPVIINLE